MLFYINQPLALIGRLLRIRQVHPTISTLARMLFRPLWELYFLIILSQNLSKCGQISLTWFFFLFSQPYNTYVIPVKEG